MSQVESRKRSTIFWNIFKIILALVLVRYVFVRADLQQFLALRKNISLLWLVITIVLSFVMTLFKAFQYYFFMGRSVKYSQVLNITVMQNAVSNFIATGAGIISYFALFRVEQGVKISRAGLTFILVKAGDLISIWLFLFTTSILVWTQIKPLHELVFVLLGGIGAVIFVFLLIVFLRQKFVAFLQTIVDRINLARFGLIAKSMDMALALAQQDKGFVLQVMSVGILSSLIYMIVTMMWIYASFQVFSFSIGVLPMVFVNILMQLVSYLPIQVFGGLGVNETASLYLYSFFSLPQGELAATLIAIRLLFYLTNLLTLLYLPLHILILNRSKKK